MGFLKIIFAFSLLLGIFSFGYVGAQAQQGDIDCTVTDKQGIEYWNGMSQEQREKMQTGVYGRTIAFCEQKKAEAEKLKVQMGELAKLFKKAANDNELTEAEKQQRMNVIIIQAKSIDSQVMAKKNAVQNASAAAKKAALIRYKQNQGRMNDIIQSRIITRDRLNRSGIPSEIKNYNDTAKILCERMDCKINTQCQQFCSGKI